MKKNIFLLIISLVIVFISAGYAYESSLDADGTLVVNGEPYFVRGVFDAYPVEELNQIAELGFNTVEVPVAKVDKAYLDLAQKLNLQVIVWFGGYNKTYLERSLPFIERFKDHPAILGWYAIDEPSNFAFAKKPLHTIYAEFKKADPNHIVVAVFNHLPKDLKHKDAVDVFGIDLYPIVGEGVPGGSIESVGVESDIACKGMDAGKPVWYCPQAFGGSKTWKRIPTADEYRSICYVSLVHGVKGLLAYAYNLERAVSIGINESPELMKAVQRVNEELKQLEPILLSGTPQIKVAKKVHAGIITAQNDAYLIVVNTAEYPVNPEIKLSVDVTGCTDVFADETLALQEAVATVALGAYDVRVLKCNFVGDVPANVIVDMQGDTGKALENMALAGKISTNSILTDKETDLPSYKYFTDKANDNRMKTNWASADEYTLPVFLQLDLPESQKVDKIVVSSKANTYYDNWKDVTIEFSDNSKIERTLADMATAQEIIFEPRTISWVRININSTYSRTHYLGCSEFELYYDEKIELNH